MVIATLLAGLSGCAGDARVVADTLKVAWNGSSAIDPTLAQSLNPHYRYLRATLDGRPFLLVLGYVDKDASTDESVDVWYTGQGEVLRLKNGRIVGMTGLADDWRQVRHFNLPAWEHAASIPNGESISFSRALDLKKNYQLSLQEQVTLTRISPPKVNLLTGAIKADLVWFSERYVSQAGMPPSQFALQKTDGITKVVYSWQCLSAQMCLSLQEWTLVDQVAAQALKAAKP